MDGVEMELDLVDASAAFEAVTLALVYQLHLNDESVRPLRGRCIYVTDPSGLPNLSLRFEVCPHLGLLIFPPLRGEIQISSEPVNLAEPDN